MKLLAIVGTNASFSYNRFLAQYIAKHYAGEAEIEVAEIDHLPAFYKEAQEDDAVHAFRAAVQAADGVIVTTPEYDHAIPAALKNALEWLGTRSKAGVMKMKPVMVVGASYGVQGASRAQEDAREILLAPDLSANVLPGNEVLIGGAAASFDKETGDLTNETYAKQLDDAFANFVKFVAQTQK